MPIPNLPMQSLPCSTLCSLTIPIITSNKVTNLWKAIVPPKPNHFKQHKNHWLSISSSHKHQGNSNNFSNSSNIHRHQGIIFISVRWVWMLVVLKARTWYKTYQMSLQVGQHVIRAWISILILCLEIKYLLTSPIILWAIKLH